MKKIVGWTGRYLLPLFLLLGAFYGSRRLIASRPEAVRQQAQDRVVPVEVVAPFQTNHTIQIEAMGQVVPASRVEVRFQVGGLVVETHEDFEVGGRIPAGTVLAKLERDDYEAALVEAESTYAERSLAEALERQRQAIAKEELRQEGADLAEGPGRDIAMRIPQVEAARRSRAAAAAGVERARRDLDRTAVRLPFDAVVLRKAIDEGSVLGPNAMIGEVAAVNRFHVEAVVPPQSLAWLPELDRDGRFAERPDVDVGMAKGPDTAWRSGYLSRLVGDMRGSMARLLIVVENPLDATEAPLLLDSHVKLRIPGKEIRDVWAIPRRAFRDDGSVLLATAENTLAIVEPEVVWKSRDMVYVSDGLTSDDRVITTTLAAAVPDMAIEVVDDDHAEVEEDYADR